MDDLQNYKLQLQQVEAALTTDPGNEELMKLKVDLEEVIELTNDLIKSQQQEKKPETNQLDPEVLAALINKWKPGDQCMAPWSEDGKYYEGTIDAISDDGVVNLTFNEYKNTDVTMLCHLKPLAKRPASDYVDRKTKLKKMAMTAIAGIDPNKQKEYLKKRKQRKLQRFKELEEEREQEKNKWLAFANKSTKKGVIKKSIFATPENVNGRVGIGTCGVSGKEMTKYSNGEKWRRGT